MAIYKIKSIYPRSGWHDVRHVLKDKFFIYNTGKSSKLFSNIRDEKYPNMKVYWLEFLPIYNLEAIIDEIEEEKNKMGTHLLPSLNTLRSRGAFYIKCELEEIR